MKKRALKKFLRFFKKGFYDQNYLERERDHKLNAHLEWEEKLNKKEFNRLLKEKKFLQIAKTVLDIEAKVNHLFSFEKTAIAHALNSPKGAELFAKGLYNYIYGKGAMHDRFNNFLNVMTLMPRKESRVLTWPVLTVFGFIADPKEHVLLKPRITIAAAKYYGYDLQYSSIPNWLTYQSLLDFANTIKTDHPELKPRDHIDLHSFITVMGSEAYS